MITLNEFDTILRKQECYKDVIVKLAYKYEWEKLYTVTNEILEYCPCRDTWEWLNDWNEGQQDVKVIGFIPVSNVPIPFFTDKILRK